MTRIDPPAADILLTAFAAFFGLCASIGILYTVAAAILVSRFFKKPKTEPSSFPPVTIVKPLRGDEWGLLDGLASFCRQDYPGPIQYLFGVQQSEDPALKVVGQLRQLFPEAHITVVADSRLHVPNRKVSNLINMMPQAVHDVLVFADSDIEVTPDYLRSVIGELQKPNVGLVTCLYRGRPAPGFWPHLSAQGINYNFLPSVVTGLALKIARPCFGQTIATRRSTLAKIGGFARFGHILVEDNAIGEAVRAAGEEAAIPPIVISHTSAESTFAALTAHELRWSRSLRIMDPLGHLGSTLTHPFPLALIAVGFSGGAIWTWPLVLIALLARVVLKRVADDAVHERRRDLWLLPLRDIYSVVILIASFFSTRVVWRGASFDVGPKGLLHPLQDD
jgi:ceramide glucosyltransferase